jgi:hypothetical protein
MARFTKELRQEIIREFAVRHNGHFNPALFVEEVRTAGADHPAYEWFEWDKDKAAAAHLVWQAREFATGLRVSFTVEAVGRKGAVSVREVSMPFAMSPVDQRKLGGGYVVSDPNDPAHMVELCRQAVTDLDRWLRRYEAALAHAGGSPAVVERQLRLLEAAVPQEQEEAA